MQWFYNMKIGKKLILSFILMAGITAFIGWRGYSGIGEVKANQDTMYVDRLIPITDLNAVHVAFLSMRISAYKMLAFKDLAVRKQLSEGIDENAAIVEKAVDKLSGTELVKEERELLDKFRESWKRYMELKEQAVASLLKLDDATALAMVSGEWGKLGTENDETLGALIDVNVKVAEDLNKATVKSAGAAQFMMIILLAAGVFLAIFLGMFIARIIGKPVNALVAAADKLALGDVNVNVEATTTDEIGDLMRSFGKMVDNIKDNASAAEEIARGNLEVDIEPKSANDVLARSMRQVVDTLRKLVGEAQMLTRAAVDGKLDTRGSADKFTGGYREIVQGVNQTLDAVIGPLNVAAEYVDRISKGDIPPKITDNYNGDFNEIKNNLNRCIDALNGLINEMNRMSDEHNKGDIDVSIPAEKFEGSYHIMAKGVNEMVGGHIAVKKKAMACIAEFGKGNFEAPLEKFPGKKAFINDTIEQMRANLKELIADTKTLVKAAVEGKLDTRADASKHQGDFKEIVLGVNKTLDAVIGPLNVAAEYVDRISKGDIPPKITDSYNGDFNEIKNNLNRCIDSLAAVIQQTDIMYQGQKAGDIDAYIPEDQFTGAYKQMVTGVNDGVRLHVTSILKMLGVISSYSEGDFAPVLEKMPGKQIIANEKLDMLRKSTLALIDDAAMLSQAAVDGKLDTRADASKHQGDFRKIIQGVNETLDAVIGPLNVAAEYVDRISKGDIPPKITDNYKGDFNEIKNNLNACIEGLGGLVEANAVLQRMTVNDYSVAVNGQYQGVFAEVAKAVNDVQERIKHVIQTVIRVSAGDMGDLDAYKQMGNGRGKRSDNDELAPSLIKMMENLRALVADAEMLAQAAVDGRLATRADASKHQGDFRKVVEGFNNTLDSVIEPVNEAVGCIEQMAEGDLSVLVTGDYKGDLANMKNALNATLDALNDILGQVNTASEQVVSGSAQVSDAAQSLSQGSTEQASSLEEITASMTEMNSQTKQNAENAQQANKLAASARDNAQTGNERMREMLGAMKEINDSSGQISKIIKVIDEIAFQTNLLALNAAVEAARAGVHGKGFAVVADEVRNLAQRSAKAAKETTELIENSIKKVENGTGIANETAKALNEIVNGVTKVTDLVGEIASASNEQAQGIAQVNQGLGQVDQVTQSNTANAEESAAAAEELSGQATQLKHMLTRFRLSNRTGGRPGDYSSEQSPHRDTEHKSNGGNGKNKVKAGSLVGLEGKRPAPRKVASATRQHLGLPSPTIDLDDDEFGKY